MSEPREHASPRGVALLRTARDGFPSICLLALPVLLALGCTAGPRASSEYVEMVMQVEQVEAQLDGEALAQQKGAMRRVYRDMAHFQTTLAELRRHRDSDAMALFEAFARPYMAERLDSLLQGERSVWHSELRPLEANLLLAKAALLIELEDRAGLADVIETLERDFRALRSTLVEYPRGENVTLQQSLAKLQEQRRAL